MVIVIVIVAIFCPFSQFCEINVSLLSLQTQPNTAPNLFQRGVEYGKYGGVVPDAPDAVPAQAAAITSIITSITTVTTVTTFTGTSASTSTSASTVTSTSASTVTITITTTISYDYQLRASLCLFLLPTQLACRTAGGSGRGRSGCHGSSRSSRRFPFQLLPLPVGGGSR